MKQGIILGAIFVCLLVAAVLIINKKDSNVPTYGSSDNGKKGRIVLVESMLTDYGRLSIVKVDNKEYLINRDGGIYPLEK